MKLYATSKQALKNKKFPEHHKYSKMKSKINKKNTKQLHNELKCTLS